MQQGIEPNDYDGYDDGGFEDPGGPAGRVYQQQDTPHPHSAPGGGDRLQPNRPADGAVQSSYGEAFAQSAYRPEAGGDFLGLEEDVGASSFGYAPPQMGGGYDMSYPGQGADELTLADVPPEHMSGNVTGRFTGAEPAFHVETQDDSDWDDGYEGATTLEDDESFDEDFVAATPRRKGRGALITLVLLVSMGATVWLARPDLVRTFANRAQDFAQPWIERFTKDGEIARNSPSNPNSSSPANPASAPSTGTDPVAGTTGTSAPRNPRPRTTGAASGTGGTGSTTNRGVWGTMAVLSVALAPWKQDLDLAGGELEDPTAGLGLAQGPADVRPDWTSVDPTGSGPDFPFEPGFEPGEGFVRLTESGTDSGAMGSPVVGIDEILAEVRDDALGSGAIAMIWRREEVPMDAISGPNRLLTPSVGRVRVILDSDDVFEGRLHALGQNRVWLEHTYGRVGLDGNRVRRIDRLAGRDTAKLVTASVPLPGERVRVRTAGGFFLYGQVIDADEDHLTLVTDAGGRITLEDAQVERMPRSRSMLAER